MEAVYTSENRDPSAAACSFQYLWSVQNPRSSTAACGEAGRGAAVPRTPLAAPPRRVTSGRCCPASQSPAPREQHPPGRRAAHAELTPYLEKRAGTERATVLGCCYQPRRRFARRSRCGARQSRPPRRPAPRDAPARVPTGRAGPGGEGRPGLVQSRSASCCPAAARALLPLSKVAPRGESTDGLPPVVSESPLAWCTHQRARGRVSRCWKFTSAWVAVLQPWWREAFLV